MSAQWQQVRKQWRTGIWSWRLPADRAVQIQLGWPLFLLPFLLFGQIVTPHPVWVVLLVTLVGLYVSMYLWMRAQVQAVTLERRRQSGLLVAGDLLREDFELRNRGQLPVLWAAFVDHSDLPGYEPGSVVACPAGGRYHWWRQVECAQRGVFRLGPYELQIGDPLGFFRAEVCYSAGDSLLIYPRVVQLPQIELPRGSAGGTAPRRRPLLGVQPAASVRDYARGDSLRYVHWPSTARRGELTVKELELEPSGDVWVVLDLDEAVQRGAGRTGTLEYGIVLAASLAAEMVAGRERRAVGLLALAGAQPVVLPPQPGQAQLWAVMAALAPARACAVPLAELLRRNLSELGRRHTLIVVTPAVFAGAAAWVAELVRAQGQGLASSVLLTAQPEDEEAARDTLQMLHRLEIPGQVLRTDVPLRAALTYRRKRKVIRNTPTGGAYTVEVEEEVG